MILFELSDIISIIEIVVNIFLAVMIGHYIQKNQINSRTLKDYYIQEIVKLQDEIINYLNVIEVTQIEPQIATSWFRSKSAKISNLASELNERYNIDCGLLVQDFIDLQNDVENDTNFIRNFIGNLQTRLTNSTIININEYRDNKTKVFHKLVGQVNDYSKKFWN